jgi:hypothetical protein
MGSDIPKCFFLLPDVCFQIDFYLLVTLMVVDVVWVHVFPVSVLHCFYWHPDDGCFIRLLAGFNPIWIRLLHFF